MPLTSIPAISVDTEVSQVPSLYTNCCLQEALFSRASLKGMLFYLQVQGHTLLSKKELLTKAHLYLTSTKKLVKGVTHMTPPSSSLSYPTCQTLT